jgi:dihydroxy-acid dehydratase
MFGPSGSGKSTFIRTINRLEVHQRGTIIVDGIELTNDDWDSIGYDIPLLVNMMPAGAYLGEAYFRAGGLPAVMAELMAAGRLHGNTLTVTGRTLAENTMGAKILNEDVIHPYSRPLKEQAGFANLKGNLFDSAIMKTSVISEAFRKRYLERPATRAPSRAALSFSTAQRTITPASTIPRSTLIPIASW